MSTWWPVIGVFWILFLLDGLRGSRRTRFFFCRAWGGSRSTVGARLSESAWVLIPPLPTAWGVATEDLPASLAAEGLSNTPSVSAGRPPPWPEHAVTFLWEEISSIESVAGWIRVNGRRFAPETPALRSETLRALAKTLKPLDLEGRRRHLQVWTRERFRPLNLRRSVQSALVRTRGLAVLNALQVGVALLVSAWVLSGVSESLSLEVQARVNDQAPFVGGGWLLAHLLAVGWFFRLHRRLYPKGGQERVGLIMTMLLVPPQALRLRQQVLARLGEGQHPLAVAAALAGRQGLHRVARNTWADLRWPWSPAREVAGTGEVTAAAAAMMAPWVERTLGMAQPPLGLAEITVPPRKNSPEVCAYCPRCGDQFTRPEGTCPYGIPLHPFSKEERL